MVLHVVRKTQGLLEADDRRDALLNVASLLFKIHYVLLLLSEGEKGELLCAVGSGALSFLCEISFEGGKRKFDLVNFVHGQGATHFSLVGVSLCLVKLVVNLLYDLGVCLGELLSRVHDLHVLVVRHVSKAYR